MPNRACRVVVFIDGQNVHQDFRRAFVVDSHGVPSTVGAFNPMLLARRLVACGPDFEDWTLAEVRVYVGSSIAEHQSTAAAAHDRQMAAWRSWGVVPRARPLSYLGWPAMKPHQKGVDVELAVDVVRMAVAKDYEIGIIASTDTDLLPAIETVSALRGTNAVPRICTVRYGDLSKRLYHSDAHGRRMHAFHLTAEDFQAVRDDTDYTVPGSSTETLISG